MFTLVALYHFFTKMIWHSAQAVHWNFVAFLHSTPPLSPFSCSGEIRQLIGHQTLSKMFPHVSLLKLGWQPLAKTAAKATANRPQSCYHYEATVPVHAS